MPRFIKFLALILMVFVNQTFAIEPLTIGLIVTGVGMLVGGAANVISGQAGIKAQRREGKLTRAFNLELFKKEQITEKKQFRETLEFKQKELKTNVESDMFNRQQDFVWKMSDNLMNNNVMQRNLVQIGKQRRA